MIVLASELGVLQRVLDTVPLTGGQWLVCIVAAVALVLVDEIIKLVLRFAAAHERRHRMSKLAEAVPGVGAVRTYQKAWLRPDLVAGIVLAAILVPQGMAYAELAGLPPVTGLYTTIACLVGYALDGPVAGAGARPGLVGVAVDLRGHRAAGRRRPTIRRRRSRSPG